MCLSSNKYINGKNLYLDKENNIMYILPEPDDKPIKIVHEDDIKVEGNGNEILISKRLNKWEAESLLMELFGTTDVATLDCGDMTDEEIDKIVDQLNSIPN